MFCKQPGELTTTYFTGPLRIYPPLKKKISPFDLAYIYGICSQEVQVLSKVLSPPPNILRTIYLRFKPLKMIRRLYAFVLLAALPLSVLEEVRAQSPGDMVLSGANEDYTGLYVYSSMNTRNNNNVGLAIPGPLSIASSIPTPGTMYQTYGGHYLEFLYKQILYVCSLYWLLAGYRRYRPKRISGNTGNLTAKF